MEGFKFEVNFDANLDPTTAGPDSPHGLPKMPALNPLASLEDDDQEEDHQIFTLLQQIQMVKQSRAEKRKAREVEAKGEEAVIAFKKQANKILQTTKKNRAQLVKNKDKVLSELYQGIQNNLNQLQANYDEFMQKMSEHQENVTQKMETLVQFSNVITKASEEGDAKLLEVQPQLKAQVHAKAEDVARALKNIKGKDDSDSIKNLLRQMIPQSVM